MLQPPPITGPAFAGFGLTIERETAWARPGEPIRLKGKFTVLNIGAPGFIYVSITGPDYAPQTRTFPALAAPFTGEWQTEVTLDQEGAYEAKAEAYPLFPIGPAIAESIRPTLLIGEKVPEGVKSKLPTGQEVTYPLPPVMAPEISPQIIISPTISFPAGVSPTPGYAPYVAPPMPTTPELPARVTVTPGEVSAGEILGVEFVEA